ncbi:MAG: tRNA pseudouridine(13) synthase TruD [Candidatus Woesearchaeota archaeon]
MHQIKQIPEDFIVKEINDIQFNDNGQYFYFILKKKNYNTLRAVQAIAKQLKINEKDIGFAGNKDKNALTEQFISVKNGNKNIENIKIRDIELKYLGRGNEKIYLGNLKGNGFIITIRNLAKKEIEKIKNRINNDEIRIPNYFGQQRLSNNNSLIGKALIKNNFKEAIDLIIGSNSDCKEEINYHLKKQKNDFVGALKIIQFRLLKLYIHSYQSFLFNKTLEQYTRLIKNNKDNHKKLINDEKLPIIGFATEINNKNIEKMINEILDKEKISLRDFIIKAIPDLSSEGSERNALIKINDFKIINQEKDELNKNKEKITVKFSLPKGSFATVLIDYLFA